MRYKKNILGLWLFCNMQYVYFAFVWHHLLLTRAELSKSVFSVKTSAFKWEAQHWKPQFRYSACRNQQATVLFVLSADVCSRPVKLRQIKRHWKIKEARFYSSTEGGRETLYQPLTIMEKGGVAFRDTMTYIIGWSNVKYSLPWNGWQIDLKKRMIMFQPLVYSVHCCNLILQLTQMLLSSTTVYESNSSASQ